MNSIINNIIKTAHTIAWKFLRVSKSQLSRLNITLCATCFLLNSSQSYSAEKIATDLYDLSLEELGNIQISIVSKKRERLVDAAASIYVITDDAIRRSGARTLPEALRLAPNLHVAQIKENQYAISARGFNSATANKLLVMIDGRTVYTPLYSGVFWDSQDVLLQDVQQIEVVSGSGGTLWGANAVNGVINIITKSAKETESNLLHVTSSNKERGVAMRHGGNFNNSGSYRVYAKFDQWDHSVRENGMAEPDAWERAQIGFRSDWTDGINDLKVLGKMFRNSIDQLSLGNESNSDTSLLARWKKPLESEGNIYVRAYVDHSYRNIPGTYSEKIDTLDVDIQHSFAEKNNSQFIWGGGYRIANDRVTNSVLVAFMPAHKQLNWANLFAQEEYSVLPDWQFTLGARLETNEYTGLEFLPNAKISWKESADKLLWLSLARAVRAPSRIDTEFYLPGNAPYLLAGGPNFRSEIANTLELGWRAKEGTLTYSIVIYHTEYDHLRSLDFQPAGSFIFQNHIEGNTQGVEALVNYQVTEHWAVEASGFSLDEDFGDVSRAQSQLGNDPRYQWMLSSTWNLNSNTQCGISLRHVGELRYPTVEAYTALDAHIGWSPLKNIELTLTGRNLDDPYHQEFDSGSTQTLTAVQMEREIDVALTVKF